MHTTVRSSNKGRKTYIDDFVVKQIWILGLCYVCTTNRHRLNFHEFHVNFLPVTSFKLVDKTISVKPVNQNNN